jgi:hypothetical protein
MRLDFCVASGRRDELEHHHIVPRNMGGSDDVVAGYCRRAERAGHPSCERRPVVVAASDARARADGR